MFAMDQYMIGSSNRQPSAIERNTNNVVNYGAMYIDNFAQS
jgi:hypothetical protein